MLQHQLSPSTSSPFAPILNKMSTLDCALFTVSLWVLLTLEEIPTRAATHFSQQNHVTSIIRLHNQGLYSIPSHPVRLQIMLAVFVKSQ